MKPPKHVRVDIHHVWSEMEDGVWLVYSDRHPNGVVRLGNADEKGTFLSDREERSYIKAYFQRQETVSGPFDRIREAVVFRDMAPAPTVDDAQGRVA